jgi:unsaturated rhamnogalacturonyl hydrolase
MNRKSFFFIAFLTIVPLTVSVQRAPAAGAQESAERMAASEMQRRGESLVYGKNPKARWVYETGVFLEGIERLGLSTGNRKYLDYVKNVVDSFVGNDGGIQSYKLDEYNLDSVRSGTLLLHLYRQSKEEKYRKAADSLMKQLETHPRTSEGGFWHKKIYPYQMWLDGIYMAEPFYAEYSRMFGRPAGFADIANQIVWIEAHARDSKTGLLYHGWDEKKSQEWADPTTGCSHNFWGRAVGWYVMGIADVLDFLPAAYPRRKEIVAIFQRTMQAISRYQDVESGLWYQVVDQGSRKGNYLEASASSMFVYALAKGIRKGYLGKEFLSAAEKGYEGILRRLIATDPDGSVHLTGICSVAGLGGPTRRNGSFEYYVGEPVVADDLKGVGAFILASVEMAQLSAGQSKPE